MTSVCADDGRPGRPRLLSWRSLLKIHVTETHQQSNKEFSSRGPSRANWMGISCNNRCFNVGVHDHRQTDPPQLCALEIGRRGIDSGQRTNAKRDNGPTGQQGTEQRDNGKGPTGQRKRAQREGVNGPTGHRESQPSLKLDAFGMFGPVWPGLYVVPPGSLHCVAWFDRSWFVEISPSMAFLDENGRETWWWWREREIKFSSVKARTMRVQQCWWDVVK